MTEEIASSLAPGRDLASRAAPCAIRHPLSKILVAHENTAAVTTMSPTLSRNGNTRNGLPVLAIPSCESPATWNKPCPLESVRDGQLEVPNYN